MTNVVLAIFIFIEHFIFFVSNSLYLYVIFSCLAQIKKLIYKFKTFLGLIYALLYTIFNILYKTFKYFLVNFKSIFKLLYKNLLPYLIFAIISLDIFSWLLSCCNYMFKLFFFLFELPSIKDFGLFLDSETGNISENGSNINSNSGNNGNSNSNSSSGIDSDNSPSNHKRKFLDKYGRWDEKIERIIASGFRVGTGLICIFFIRKIGSFGTFIYKSDNGALNMTPENKTKLEETINDLDWIKVNKKKFQRGDYMNGAESNTVCGDVSEDPVFKEHIGFTDFNIDSLGSNFNSLFSYILEMLQPMLEPLTMFFNLDSSVDQIYIIGVLFLLLIILITIIFFILLHIFIYFYMDKFISFFKNKYINYILVFYKKFIYMHILCHSMICGYLISTMIFHLYFIL